MVDKSKYQCPYCGGQCDKIMTVVWLENAPEGKDYLMFAERTCKVCAGKWIRQERIITYVARDIQVR